MHIAGAIIFPDECVPLQQQHDAQAMLRSFYDASIDPVIVVGPKHVAQHPSVQNRYQRFASFGPVLTALLWTKTTPAVTAPIESHALVENFLPNLVEKNFLVARQSAEQSLLVYGDEGKCEQVAMEQLNHESLVHGKFQNLWQGPVLWPADAGLVLRKALSKFTLNPKK